MPPRERAAWIEHFKRHPPGDFLAQRLLAQLCALIASQGRDGGVHPRAFAPWLDWDSGKPDAADALENRMGAMLLDAKQAG